MRCTQTDHFVTTLESQRHTAVFGVACFGIDATEDTGVGTCDAENTCKGGGGRASEEGKTFSIG